MAQHVLAQGRKHALWQLLASSTCHKSAYVGKDQGCPIAACSQLLQSCINLPCFFDLPANGCIYWFHSKHLPECLLVLWQLYCLIVTHS